MASGFWREARADNLLDGAAYFYRAYETSDGEYMAVGAIEPQFHAALIAGLGLELKDFAEQMDPARWKARSAVLEAVFRTRSRAAWEAVFAPLDACVTAVLRPSEAVREAANVERGVFGKAPRFMRKEDVLF
jgi:alpha-methylacyl-CoA racemase